MTTELIVSELGVARKTEAQMLAACVRATQSESFDAAGEEEANVFRLAATVLFSKNPTESARLLSASDRYFSQHPEQKLPPAEVVNKGWVSSLPRLRDMLRAELCHS
jgi:hypothetical protein